MFKKFVGWFSLSFLLITLIVFTIAYSESEKQKKDDLYQNLELFADTLTIIQADYVEPTNSKDLIYGSLKGMMASLDPYSQFLTPEDYNELKIDTRGKFGGIGIEITIKDGILTVISPIEDTPAWDVGIKAGDKIVKIEDELTRDMTLTEAVKKMRGKPGTELNITVLREKEGRLIDFKIVRAIIKIKDIKQARILEDGIGYIRLVEFRENTPRDLDKVLKKLSKENMNGLILDLRYNPGGLLDIAVKVTERFLKNGKVIVSTKGREDSQGIEFISRYNKPYLDLPLVVLINEGSASGSEIVAGALQDYRRALVVGTKSFGKGSVQSVIPLSDGSALRLTTSKYFTPKGRSIHGEGIVPDITVEAGRVELAESDKEKKVEDVFTEVEKKMKPEGLKEKARFDYKTDNQLMHAVDLLKAIRLFKTK